MRERAREIVEGAVAQLSPYLDGEGRAILGRWADVARAVEEPHEIELMFQCSVYVRRDGDESSALDAETYASPARMLASLASDAMIYSNTEESVVDLRPMLPEDGWPDPVEWRLSHV